MLLKSKKEIDWQDEKLLEELIKKREQLEEENSDLYAKVVELEDEINDYKYN